MANKKRLTIVLCANSSWYIHNFRKNTIKAFIKKGHRVVVVAPYDKSSKKLSSLATDYYEFNLNPDGTNIFLEIGVIFKLISLYLRIKPDFVMNFTPKMNIYSTIASVISKSKVINNISGLGTAFTKDSFFSKFVFFLYRLTQIFADKVFFQNKNDMEMFISRNIVDKDKCEYIPGSGVDLNYFNLIESPDDGVVRFIMVCRMLYEKGIENYAKAAEFCKKKYGDKINFIAIGLLDEHNNRSVPRKVMNQWEKLGILLHKDELEDVRSEIAHADCIVLPSIYAEGTPKSLLEGASMGKPIITTNMPGCASTVVEGVNGYLCKPNSISDLVSCMEKIYKLTHKCRLEMGLRGRELMEEKFDEQIVIKKYLEQLH